MWDMTRSERKMWVALIRAQKDSESKAVSKEDYREARGTPQEDDSSEDDD